MWPILVNGVNVKRAFVREFVKENKRNEGETQTATERREREKQERREKEKGG